MNAPDIYHFDPILKLPCGLGEIQNYIYGRMKYPNRATAGVAAISALQSIAMGTFVIDIYNGLGLNEYYMMLSPTGSGKEDLRQAIEELVYRARTDGAISEIVLPKVKFNLPASPQAAHTALSDCNGTMIYLADEFAEWLGSTAKDGARQGVVAYLMEAYTRALKSINVPASMANVYKPVDGPRIGAFTTSTWERTDNA